ncbi:unnamed protein product [Ranitomeya imitator]|uniref:AP-4 complex subunit epsilon-1 C-terminal domain-containing protein n=1 Tax=Ranitomeya imitator TaxID=111125 RepID=A0ABN9L1P4_9NEOB|nr:unnamed protein product [Ranitomeya imitator]
MVSDIGKRREEEENRLKMEGIRKVWGKEGYLLKKESKMSKSEPVSPPLESGISMGEDEEPAVPSPEPSVELISTEAREKQQLASSLFVGLGSNAVSLMGKPDQTTQKFKRKSKFGKKANAQLLYPPGEQNHLAQTLPSDVSSAASRLLPAQGDEENSVQGKVSSLFANSNLETYPSSQGASTIVCVPSLPPELAQHSHSAVTELAHCGTLTVCSSKVWKDDCLVLALFIVNPTSSAIRNINLQVEGSELLTVSRSLCCQLSHLEENGVHQCWGSVHPTHPCKKELIHGCVTYLAESEVPSRLEFSLDFVLSDFIRPLMISTEEFGKMWPALSNDVKGRIQISSPQQRLSETLLLVQQALNFHVVEVIVMFGLDVYNLTETCTE